MTAFAVVEAAAAVSPKSPPAVALREHARKCPQCREAALANRSWRSLCAAGQLLVRCAQRARARRAR